MSDVIDIGEWKMKRRVKMREASDCKHLNMTMIPDGGYVLCDDCGASLSAFFVLDMLCDRLQLELHKARKARKAQQGSRP